MVPCKYAQILKCESCNVCYYNTCKKFVVAHAHDLTKVLQPFTLQKLVSLTTNVVWSPDINKAKSAAMSYCLKDNSEVKRLSTSQVLSIMISNQELTGNVFFIDASSKPTGDLEKVKGVLTSFVDEVVLQGGYVSIYTKLGLFPQNFDYQKI